MSAAEGVPLTRELLGALMNVAGVLLDQAVGNEPSPGRAEEAARELADACAVLVSACGDSLLVDACAAAGVPAWARPVLESLRELADATRDTTVSMPLAVAAARVELACRAALESDAGEVREHLYDYSRHIYHLGAEETAAAAITAVNEARDSGYKVIVEVSGFGALEFYAIPERGTAPLDESGAAPEERDGELSRLLWRFCEQAQPLGRPDLIEIALDAIHAHVAQVKREAHDIGFRRGLRELPPDLRRPPEDDELPRAVDMMAAMEAPDAHP